MKKMNRKGFVLAEAIVVAVFVLGMFTYLAINIIPLITKYEQALKYDNPQEVYAANILLDELINYNNFYSNYGIDLFDINDENNENYVFFEEIKKQLNIKDILVEQNCDDFSNRTIEEYCKHLETKGDFSYNITGSHVWIGSKRYTASNVTIIIEFNNGRFASVNSKIREI